MQYRCSYSWSVPSPVCSNNGRLYRNQSVPPSDHSLNFNPRNGRQNPTDQRVVANFNTMEAFTDLFNTIKCTSVSRAMDNIRRRNRRTICEPLSRSSDNPSTWLTTNRVLHTKYTVVLALNAPQDDQVVPCSNPERDKVYTNWMYCVHRLSLRPYVNLESVPRLGELCCCWLPLVYCPGWLHLQHSTSC